MAPTPPGSTRLEHRGRFDLDGHGLCLRGFNRHLSRSSWPDSAPSGRREAAAHRRSIWGRDPRTRARPRIGRLVSSTEELTAALRAELRLAERGRLAENLRELADQIRARYGVELPSTTESRSLLSLCAAVWERRHQLLAGGSDRPGETERALRTDLLELASIGADLRVSHAPETGLADAQRRPEAAR